MLTTIVFALFASTVIYHCETFSIVPIAVGFLVVHASRTFSALIVAAIQARKLTTHNYPNMSNKSDLPLSILAS